jgi:hypothetical protein
VLQITAQQEAFQPGFEYTSARMHTRKHPVAGQIQPPKNAVGTWVDGGAVQLAVRAQLPAGTPSGTWPAFWMLPTTKVSLRHCPSAPAAPACMVCMHVALWLLSLHSCVHGTAPSAM